MTKNKDAIRIDPTLSNLLPPLQPHEAEGLEADIVRDGCLSPLIVWNQLLVDGHNRYAICQKHDISFSVRRMQFASLGEACLWAWDHQDHRRSMNAFVRGERLLQCKQIVAEIKAKAKERMLAGKATDPVPILAQGKARDELAARVGVSHGTFDKIEEIVEEADEETKEKLRTEQISISAAAKDVRRKRRKAANEQARKKRARPPKGKYEVIVVDPPWPMEKIERDCRPNQVAPLDYPTMTEDELAAVKLPTAPDCHVFLWTTHRFLPMALRLLTGWKLKYVCTFVWHKPGGFQPVGLPQFNCEFALYARKGSPKFVDTKAFPTCFKAPRGNHSEKPETFYDLIRRVSDGQRLDMFNRRKIKGFDGWGTEAPE